MIGPIPGAHTFPGSIDPSRAPVDGVVVQAQAEMAQTRWQPGPRDLTASQPRAIFTDNPAGPSAIAGVAIMLPPQLPSGGNPYPTPMPTNQFTPYMGGNVRYNQ